MSRRGGESNKHDETSTDFSGYDSYIGSADGDPDSLLLHSDSSQVQQREDSSNSLSEISGPNYQMNGGLLEELKNHYLKPGNKTSQDAATSCKPATTQKINNFLYRRNALPVNVTPMSERQKSRLEMFRESASTNGTNQVNRLPHHVAITRSRPLGQLSAVINADEICSVDDQLTGIANNIRYQSAIFPGRSSSIAHQLPIRRPGVAIVTYQNDESNCRTAHTNGHRSGENEPRNFRQHIRQHTVGTDYPEDRSTSTLGEDDMSSTDQDLLAYQGTADSPLKKAFGDGGSFVQLKANKMPVLKSMWGSVKAKVHITVSCLDNYKVLPLTSVLETEDGHDGVQRNVFSPLTGPQFGIGDVQFHDIL